MTDPAPAIEMLLRLSEEPLKAWELHRAIGGRRSDIDVALDLMTLEGRVVSDQHGYYRLTEVTAR